MTVRWRPLIVLSGVFLVVAVGGVLTVALDLFPSSSEDILPTARKEWSDGKFNNAQIHFQRALQLNPRDPEIHEEMARMYADWVEQEADPSIRGRLRAERLSALGGAAKYGKEKGPRRELLLEALADEDRVQSELWAKKLLDLDADDPDGHYALAMFALDDRPADVATAKRHLEFLLSREPQRSRTAYIQAALARATGEKHGLGALLRAALDEDSSATPDVTDRQARLRLLQIDVLEAGEIDARVAAVDRLAREADDYLDDPAISPARVALLARQLAEVEDQILAESTRQPADDPSIAGVLKSLEKVAEEAFRKALDNTGASDLAIARRYAQFLLDRGQLEHCREVVDKALAQPGASLPLWAETVTQLRETAIKAALLDVENPDRQQRAEPHIQALIASLNETHRAVGHLFQGVIDLERSGITEASRTGVIEEGGETPDAERRAKFRKSALTHLERAARGLPEVATAQALYGVALTLTGEMALGRQYLTAARRMPGLEPRYQVWSAWTMIQAGYPEEAESIVSDLRAAHAAGTLSPDLVPTMHLLAAEVALPRRTPEALDEAKAAYEAALAAGQPDTPSIQIRIAQIDVLRGKPQDGLNRVQALRERGQGGPQAEAFAVLILNDAGHTDKARKHLEAARRLYPKSGELARLDADLWVAAGQPEEADGVLAKFLETQPGDEIALQARARILTENLRRPDEARDLLAKAASQAESSTSLIQIALIDLARKDHEAVARTIATIRERWRDAASADLLEAQLALARSQPREAIKHLEIALKKDPSNKLALFWKAQLDERAGSPEEAQKIYESIVKASPVKELDDGLSLATAAQWALANHALDNDRIDEAITQFEDLLQGGITGEMSRPVRWRLATARASRGDWTAARQEIENLLESPSTTAEERVRAANLYRLYGDPARAVALLDPVLASDPGNTSAVAIRAYLLAETNPAGATELVRKAIATGGQPASIYLMLAALENLTPPAETGLDRALTAVDEGLAVHTTSVELVQARYRVLTLAGKHDLALSDLEARSKNDPSGTYRRLLVDIHRDEKRYEAAETIVRQLFEETPEDVGLATALVGLVSLRASEASRAGDRRLERNLNDELTTLVRRFRNQFPEDVNFPTAECELAARAGQLDRAVAITREIDEIAPTSPIGPYLRGQIAEVRGWTEGMVKEYGEAVARAPRHTEIRLMYGEACLALRRYELALEQADALLNQDSGNLRAVLLKAHALSRREGAAGQVRQGREEAVRLLMTVLQSQPTFAAAYHLIADIRMMDGDRKAASETLKRGLQVVRHDSAGLLQLVQILSQPDAQGRPATNTDLREAADWAERMASQDQTGQMALSASIGYHRAGQIDLALPWAEKAVEVLDTWVAHLNYADLLLARAESASNPDQAQPLFERAIAEYDRVLESNANSIEAINNKAWILHAYLGRHAEALAVVEALRNRVDPSVLPPDFFDTLGSIHEAMNRTRDAESAYGEGLRRSADHPVLNYHMGRLLAADDSRSLGALPYLRKAHDAKDSLPPAMAAELETLMRGSAN